MKKFFNRRRATKIQSTETWKVLERETNYKHFEGSPEECIQFIRGDIFDECYLVDASGQVIEGY